MYNFSEKELSQIKNQGLNIDKINTQLLRFKKGFPFADLQDPATTINGIKKLSESELKSNIDSYNKLKNDKKIVKFVPASGAASRMFKFLFEFHNKLDNNTFKNIINDNKDAKIFFDNINQFPFYKELNSISTVNSNDDKYAQEIINNLLKIEGLNYAKLPKAFIKFHNYKDESRFAIEEHLAEAAEYACSNNKEANIHFTVSEEHKKLFNDKLKVLSQKYKDKYGISYNIELSIQKPSTDTIAVDLDNNPYKNKDGELVFRPGGHGSLIENLNEIDADIIFIKNIDNIVTDSKRQITIDYKRALGGLGLKLYNKIIYAIKDIIENGNIKEAEEIIIKDLSLICDEEYNTFSNIEKQNYLIKILNRPIRICGMVKNEGEPGGGPFWVNKNGQKSLQIVEGSEINTNIESQKVIVNNATHFNPVDLICITKDYKGAKFELKDFIDHDAGFISEKSINGETVKAMELPGLWNGAMSKWNTIFVEVPIETFNPVKTVNDLLRDMHQ